MKRIGMLFFLMLMIGTQAFAQDQSLKEIKQNMERNTVTDTTHKSG